MRSPIPRRLPRFFFGLCGLAGASLATPALADIINTSKAGQVSAFQAGADVENFDDLDGTPLSSYAPGQVVAPGSRFSSRDGTEAPTFHSGGGSPNDPVGNPGTPIAIISPSGAIIGDVESGENVAAPVVINTDEPWNNGFMEVIFPIEVDKVGFWVTHGTIRLTLRNRSGGDLETGDVEVVGTAGNFIGIERDAQDIAVAAIFNDGGGDAYTFDDFTSTADPVPEASASLGSLAGALVLIAARRLRAARA
jgi:hypothetical protein